MYNSDVSDVLEQWEPKIHSILRGAYVRGEDYDDTAQHLRIAAARAVRRFDASRGVSFHTYLHITLVNALRTRIARAMHRPVELVWDDTVEVMHPVAEPPEEPLDILKGVRLDGGELIVMDLLMCGYKISEIDRLCVQPGSAFRALQRLRHKMKSYANEYGRPRTHEK